MTDIKQIYTSHLSLVGTVTPSVIHTVPFSLGGGTVRITSGVTVPTSGASVYICILYYGALTLKNVKNGA